MHDRKEVRDTVACPKCKAKIGEPCVYTGKGSEKAMRRGSNHQARADAATEIDRIGKGQILEVIE